LDHKRTCGKCKIKVEGLPEIKSDKEKKLLGSKSIEKGYRLACYNLIKADMDIYLDDSKQEAKIMTETKSQKIRNSPQLKKKHERLSSCPENT